MDYLQPKEAVQHDQQFLHFESHRNVAFQCLLGTQECSKTKGLALEHRIISYMQNARLE